MTDQELKDLVASLAIESKKTDEKLARMGIHLAGISNNQGDVAEEYFINSLKNKSLKIADMNFDMLVSNMEVSRGGKHDEYDIILVNGESLAIIEVKYKVHPSDIDKLDKKVISIKELSPVYKDFKVYAGVAGFKVPHDAKTKALDKGYFVLERKGNIVETYANELKVA